MPGGSCSFWARPNSTIWRSESMSMRSLMRTGTMSAARTAVEVRTSAMGLSFASEVLAFEELRQQRFLLGTAGHGVDLGKTGATRLPTRDGSGRPNRPLGGDLGRLARLRRLRLLGPRCGLGGQLRGEPRARDLGRLLPVEVDALVSVALNDLLRLGLDRLEVLDGHPGARLVHPVGEADDAGDDGLSQLLDRRAEHREVGRHRRLVLAGARGDAADQLRLARWLLLHGRRAIRRL